MFVYNSRHPMGAESGIDIPDRISFATDEQSRVIAANRAAAAHRDQSFEAMIGNAAGVIGNASPLPRDVWGEWDREGIEVQREVLSVFGDLAASVGMPMPIGKLVHYFQQVSDSGTAHVSLDGRSKARTDQPTITYQGTPLPIVDSSFSFGWRQMAAAETEGFALDGAARRNANFKVAEKLEDMAINGDSQIVVGGDQLYGLTNHPQRNTRSTTNDLSACTGAEWLADVNATLALLHGANFRVPATLYVNWDDWFYATQTDFSAAYPNKTIAQRVLENGGVREVIPASNIAADEIVAVVKDRRVVQVLSAMPMATRQQFRANPEDDYNFVVMAAQALEIKFDAENNCGVAHSS
ncbi:major capsid protein [uncultured Mameliella sp.]|uniref:major capsid protein n=1 Tax=uncultured Mameliella sp. TaxID=1447087 RepID=UPI00262531C2|nr:major capsid protein [uncultured Mameliella sp.]